MKFKEELIYIDLTFKQFLEGASIDEIKINLNQEDLYNLDIDKVLRSAKGKILDKYEDRVVDIISDAKLQDITSELTELHSSTIDYLIKFVRNKLKQKERIKVKKLLYDNQSTDDILGQVRLDLYSKGDVENKIK